MWRQSVGTFLFMSHWYIAAIMAMAGALLVYWEAMTDLRLSISCRLWVRLQLGRFWYHVQVHVYSGCLGPVYSHVMSIIIFCPLWQLHTIYYLSPILLHYDARRMRYDRNTIHITGARVYSGGRCYTGKEEGGGGGDVIPVNQEQLHCCHVPGGRLWNAIRSFRVAFRILQLCLIFITDFLSLTGTHLNHYCI